MNFSEHSRAGIITAVVLGGAGFFYFKDFDRAVLIVFAGYIGAVFPDLDTDSIPSRRAAQAGLVTSFICVFLNKPWLPAILGTLFFLIKSGKHRGFIHKYWLPAVCFALGTFLSEPLCFAFGIGLVTHFALDGITLLSLRNWY